MRARTGFRGQKSEDSLHGGDCTDGAARGRGNELRVVRSARIRDCGSRMGGGSERDSSRCIVRAL